jgi:hypothetical protein
MIGAISYKAMVGLTLTKEQREDFLSDFRLDILTHLHLYNPERSTFYGWVKNRSTFFRMGHDVIDRFTPLTDWNEPLYEVEEGVVDEVVKNAWLEGVNETHRESVRLHLEGYTLRQIAKMVGKTHQAVQQGLASVGYEPSTATRKTMKEIVLDTSVKSVEVNSCLNRRWITSTKEDLDTSREEFLWREYASTFLTLNHTPRVNQHLQRQLKLVGLEFDKSKVVKTSFKYRTQLMEIYNYDEEDIRIVRENCKKYYEEKYGKYC